MPLLERLNRLATHAVTPDLTLLFDLPVATGLARRRSATETNRLDRESLRFHQKFAPGSSIWQSAIPDACTSCLRVPLRRQLPARLSVPWHQHSAGCGANTVGPQRHLPPHHAPHRSAMPFADVIGHEHAKTLLQSAMLQNRLAHAYLFHGEDRIGKRLLALRLAQTLLCETVSDARQPDACGACRACRQVDARTHPDFLVIEPDQEMANPKSKLSPFETSSIR